MYPVEGFVLQVGDRGGGGGGGGIYHQLTCILGRGGDQGGGGGDISLTTDLHVSCGRPCTPGR